MNNKKILILGNANSPFVIHFAKWANVKRPNYKIDILNTSDKYTSKLDFSVTPIFPENHFQKPSKLNSLTSLYYFRKAITKINNSKYDIIILHYINPWYAVFSKLLKRKTKKLIAVFWGSDLNRITASKKERLKKLFNLTDAIILGSPFLLDKITKEIPQFTAKYNMCYFGCEPIEKIKEFKDTNTILFKEHFEISPNKISISLGYNGGIAQQHLKMIKNIKGSKELFKHKDNIHFIFSLTYGLNNNYKNELLNNLLDFPFSYTILTAYMDEEESARLRIATDIFVNVQLTDSFNGTLRESFYANSIVINGSWLPYKTLKEHGLYFKEISSINKLDDELIYCINHFTKEKEKHSTNQNIIYNIASWSKTIDTWLNVMEQ